MPSSKTQADTSPTRLPELTPEEIKNGWVPEDILRMQKESEARAFDRIFPERKKITTIQNGRAFNPHVWRR